MADSTLREIQGEPEASCGRNKKLLNDEDMSKELLNGLPWWSVVVNPLFNAGTQIPLIQRTKIPHAEGITKPMY